MEQIKVGEDGTDGKVESMKAYEAARDESKEGAEVSEQHMVSSAFFYKVDAMLQNLEKEIDDVDAKIGDHWRILDIYYDGKVTPGEVAAAATYLNPTRCRQSPQVCR